MGDVNLKDSIMGPVDVVARKIAESVPNLISVVLILLVGWFLANMVQKIVTRFLKLARLDVVSEKSGIANVLLKGDIAFTLAEIIGAIVYWMFMLVVVLAAINALNLNVAAGLLNSVVLYIPHVIAGLFVLVLGIFSASVLSAIVRTTAVNSGIKQAKGLGQTTQIVVVVFTVVQALKQLQLDVTIFNLLIQGVVGALALGTGLAIGLGCKDLAGQMAKDLLNSFKK